ncbi:MAG: phosphoribosylpyrophosphate synthetase [Flammeovirgaceae bacterium]|nr:phosphoribosylpyrophosphate synthetase [Flammeovirgaceae bacterium]
MKKQDATEKMTTLSEQVDKVVSQGYKENFRVVNGALTSEKASHPYKAHQVVIVNCYRFEGYSNREYNSILYLIETQDGKKGTLVVS